MKKLLLLFTFSFSLFTLNAQQWLWAKQGENGIKSSTWAPSVATDRTGNVWHIGTFYTTLILKPDTLIITGTEDLFLLKYDNNGNLLWAKQTFGASGSICWGEYVAADDSGNAYITGHFKGSVTFGSITLPGSGSYFAVFVAKFDKNGNLIWAKQSATTGNVTGIGQSIACDGKGYEYVTGYFYGGTLSFGTNSVTSVNPASFLAKYDYNGNVIWATQSSGTADSTFANSVATSRTGDEYVTGYFNGTPSFGTYNLDAHYYDIFLTKYDPNGNVLWAEQSTGNNTNVTTSSFDEGMSVAADNYDNTYLTGYFAGKLVFGSDSVTTGLKVNIFYEKCAPNGNLKWLKQAKPLDNAKWYGFSVSTDSYNHFYLTGSTPFGAGKIAFEPDSLILDTNLYGGATVLVKFDSSGKALCGDIFPDYNEFWCHNGEASDSSGNYVYFGGEFSDETLVLRDTLVQYNGGDLPITARWTGCSDINFTTTIIATPSTPCKYTCNGSAKVTPVGGNTPYTYLWNTGQTTQTITGLCEGTYSVIVTDSAGYKSVQTVNVISPPGNLKIAHTYDSICTGGSVNFTASGVTSYKWFPTAGLSCNTCPNPTATPTITTTYSVTGRDTNTAGCLDTASITVLVTPHPSITITQETSSCSGEILLEATGATTYDWSPIASLSCSSCANTYATPTVTTTYTIIGSTNGCPDTTTITVSPAVSDSINLTVRAPYDTICLGDTAQLTAAGNNVTRWAWNPATGLSCTTCPNPEASPTITTTYYVYAFDSSGCDEEALITIKVIRHTATITVLPDSICPGDSALLVAKGGITYLWSTSQTSDSIWVNPSISSAYSVTTTSKGCVAHASATVNVTTPPLILVSPSRDTICKGLTVPVSASGASSYSWLPSASLSCNTCPNPQANPTITTTYTVTGTSTAGCTGTNTITIVVKPPPSGSITASADTVCSGDTTLLKGSGGGTYLWSNGKTIDSINVHPDSASTYTLVVTKYGCSDTVNKTIQVFSKASATMSVSKDSVCIGDTVILTAGGATSFKWSNGATTSSIKVSPTSNKTYTLIAKSKCATDTVINTIHVFPYPKPEIKGNTTVCNGKKDTLTASGGTTYLWSTGLTSTKITPVISGTTTITLTAYNGACSKDTDIIITTLPSPTVTINSPKPVCAGDKVILTATGGGEYLWSTGSTKNSITVNPAVTTVYSVEVTNSKGCSTDDSASAVVDVPVIYACCDSTILTGGSIALYADSSYKYKWEPSTGLKCDTCRTITVSPTITTTYTVIGTDKTGCTVERIITVIVEPPCQNYIIPNVFTPNGDGRNDEFVIKSENVTDYSIIIYDRWGKEMYNSTNPAVYWNGNTESGGEAPDGIYYYIIKSICQNVNYTKDGFVQLIR